MAVCRAYLTGDSHIHLGSDGAGMKVTKRRFLQMSAAGLALGPRGLGARTDRLSLRAGVADIQLLPERYGKTRIWGFEGLAPGLAGAIR